jgi:hypothetical protein
VVDAAVVEADLDGHRSRVAEERRRRHVAMSRTEEAGLRTVIARVTAGEAAWVDATVTRVAIAFGYLARPAETPHGLGYLVDHRGTRHTRGSSCEPAEISVATPLTRTRSVPGSSLTRSRLGEPMWWPCSTSSSPGTSTRPSARR